jgi:hypothetical protein
VGGVKRFPVVGLRLFWVGDGMLLVGVVMVLGVVVGCCSREPLLVQPAARMPIATSAATPAIDLR